MSWEYFAKVKMTRGDVSDSSLNSHRGESYFSQYDALSNGDDFVLARK
jgi:sortase (surface protein transpeptidase)